MREGTYIAQVWSFDASTGNVVATIDQLFGATQLTIRPSIMRGSDVPRIAAVATGDTVAVYFQGDDDSSPRWMPRVIDPAQTAFYDARYSSSGTGTTKYVHTQGVAATTWTINHNLGYYPQVALVDFGGHEFEADITHSSVNQTIATMNVLVDGTATCE